MKRKLSSFTLIELLVVIVIIIILVGMLIPVIAQARRRSYSANCRENLAQLGKSIQMYRPDYDDYMPFWLSDLHGAYGVSKDLLICPQDYSAGHDGGRPGGGNDTFKAEDYNVSPIELEDKFPETDDTEFNNHVADFWQPRQFAHKIKRCSYMYEFAAVKCTSWSYGGEDIWYKMKYAQFKTDTMTNGKSIQAYEFPVVRCFYHWGVMWGNQNYILNTAMDGSTFVNNDVWKDGRLD